jgi:hypothetical protein
LSYAFSLVVPMRVFLRGKAASLKGPYQGKLDSVWFAMHREHSTASTAQIQYLHLDISVFFSHLDES